MTVQPNTSVSHGTLNPAHLIPCYASIVEENAAFWEPPYRHVIDDLISDAKATKDFEDDEAYYVLEALEDAMDDLAPEGCFFGAHPGDGSDFGWWVSQEEQP